MTTKQQKAPEVFLGSFEIEWRSILPTAVENAAQSIGPAAAAEAVSYHEPHEIQWEQQQQLFAKLLDIESDGRCCLCFLNGCFRLKQPRGLLTHARVTQGSRTAADTASSHWCTKADMEVETPLDMFIALKLEIRGPALAMCCAFPRQFLPEDLQLQQQQAEDQQHGHHHGRQPQPGCSEASALICHDVQWRHKARRSGVWTPPSSIGKQYSACI